MVLLFLQEDVGEEKVKDWGRRTDLILSGGNSHRSGQERGRAGYMARAPGLGVLALRSVRAPWEARNDGGLDGRGEMAGSDRFLYRGKGRGTMGGSMGGSTERWGDQFLRRKALWEEGQVGNSESVRRERRGDRNFVARRPPVFSSLMLFSFFFFSVLLTHTLLFHFHFLFEIPPPCLRTLKSRRPVWRASVVPPTHHVSWNLTDRKLDPAGSPP